VLVTTASATLPFDAVVVATGAHAAGKILKPLLGSAADVLLSAQTLSSVNVSLCYPSRAFPRLAGSGFIAVEAGAVEGFRACSYASLKLPYRAPDGITVLRAFFRPEDAEILRLADADWVARAERVLKRALGFDEVPLSFRVARWQDALPVHSPAFRDAVSKLEVTLRDRGVYLAGSAFHGSGIDAALRSTDVAIRQICGANTLFVTG
jgi:oxygen-dependent protoporphyrinogen oxidase